MAYTPYTFKVFVLLEVPIFTVLPLATDSVLFTVMTPAAVIVAALLEPIVVVPLLLARVVAPVEPNVVHVTAAQRHF